MKVAVVAPGSHPPWAAKLDFKKFKEIASSDLGIQVDFIGEWKGTDPFFSHSSDEQRAREFQQALDGDADVVWCARGGYGCARVLPYLRKPKSFKWVVGYSDVTAIHSFMWKRWGWKSLHAPVFEALLRRDSKQEQDLVHVLEFLRGNKQVLLQKSFSLEALNSFAEQSQKITSEILGGNLSVFQTLIGTPWMPSLRGKFLMLEDCDERGYRVHRMLSHLLASRCLDGVLSVIFGEFTGGLESSGKSYVDFAIQRFAQEVNVPVWKNLPIGHGSNNTPIIHGGNVRIQSREMIQVL